MTPTWHPQGPLPAGVTLLEASAGTGKTFSIADLALRFVGEIGADIERLLLVTYTVAATAELRARVRARLTHALGVAKSAATASDQGDGAEPHAPAPAHEDAPQDVPEWLVARAHRAGSLPELIVRLERALQRFDLAGIHTIHGFCQRVLSQFAMESGNLTEPELLTDARRLFEPLVEDFLIRELHRASPTLVRAVRGGGVNRADLLGVVLALDANPNAQIDPPFSATDSDPMRPWELACEALRAAWASERGSTAELLTTLRTTHPGVKGTYTPKRIVAEAERLDEALHDLSPLLDGDEPPVWLRFFSGAQVSAKAGEAVSHPVFDAVDALIAARTAPAERFRLAFAHHAREALDAERARQNVRTYSDLLREVDAALVHPSRGPTLIAALRSRYQVALVDEFQDTDALQWRVFYTLFGPSSAVEDAPRWLFLIGDPKQAIYGFRGADLQTYLGAAQAADRRFALGTNWRSDRALVRGLNHLLALPGLFGDPRIHAHPVNTPPARVDRLLPSHAPGAVELRLIEAHDKERAEFTIQRAAREAAAYALALLSGPRDAPPDAPSKVPPSPSPAPSIVPPSPAPTPAAPWTAGELAVLVRTNRQAAAIQHALQAVGVPAVRQGAGSVWAADTAEALHHTLNAILRPTSERAARTAWASKLFGVPAHALAEPHPARADEWAEQAARWRDLWSQSGFFPMLHALMAETGMAARLLGAPAGERALTNLLHLGELLHEAGQQGQQSPAALVEWLAHQRAEQRARPDAGGDAAELRLESEAAAVRIVTVHKSKGLEYPVVLCPFLWSGGNARVNARTLLCRPPGGRAVLDLGLADRPEKRRRIELVAEEHRAEDARLLYVALTRARHKVVLWTTAPPPEAPSALHALLFGRAAAGSPSPHAAASARFAEAAAPALAVALGELAAELPDSLQFRPPDGSADAQPAPPPWPAPPMGANAPRARAFTRERLDTLWRRGSFSALVRGATHPPPSGSPDDAGQEVEPTEALAPAPDALRAEPDPPPPGSASDALWLDDFPRGTGPGTFLHAVLEHLDFTSAQAPGQLESLCASLASQHALPLAAPAQARLCAGLREALGTPLGPPVGDEPFSALATTDCLRELAFEIPICGGWTPTPGSNGPAAATAVQLAAALGVGKNPPPAAWREQVAALPTAPLRGFLTGSVDLVFRREVEGGVRWFLVDWKSNHLAGADGASLASHYHPDTVNNAMASHHYFLQYHLYCVALRRYLHHRLGQSFSWDRDFGGVLYVFLRGLSGPNTPAQPNGVPFGVHFDRPPEARILAMQAALTGEAAE